MIELMVAVTVALLLLAALAAMYGTQVRTRNEIERANQQIENGRYATQVLRDDLRLAGFFGEFDMRNYAPSPPPAPTALPDVCVTHLSAIPNDGTRSLDGWATDRDQDGDIDGIDYLIHVMRLHVQGFDVDNGAVAPPCVADVRADTDILVVRRALSCVAGQANCPYLANAPHIQASQCNTEIQTLTTVLGRLPMLLRADANAGQFNLRNLQCTATTPVPAADRTPVRRYVTHIYYIANNNVAGDGVPTLKRLELQAGGFVTVPLVEGIEDLQLEYGIDRAVDSLGNPDPLDGSPDAYVTDPGGSGDFAADAAAWNAVMTVRVHLLSRATEARPGYTDNNTYTLGAKNIPAPGDGFMRQVFDTLVQLHNPVRRRQ